MLMSGYSIAWMCNGRDGDTGTRGGAATTKDDIVFKEQRIIIRLRLTTGGVMVVQCNMHNPCGSRVHPNM